MRDKRHAAAPKTCRKALGLYVWDFTKNAPVPAELMKHQCDLGLKWLREGRVSELIVLGSTLLDNNLESAEWARRWIQEVGSLPLPSGRE